MILKKNLKSKKAQAAVEYITIFIVILAIFAAFLSRVSGTLETYHNGMVNRIATQ